jgi:hypothetical protein
MFSSFEAHFISETTSRSPFTPETDIFRLNTFSTRFGTAGRRICHFATKYKTTTEINSHYFITLVKTSGAPSTTDNAKRNIIFIVFTNLGG